MRAQRETRYPPGEITLFLRSRHNDADGKDALKYLPKIRHPTLSATREDCLHGHHREPKP
jgi:hypothetical protein